MERLLAETSFSPSTLNELKMQLESEQKQFSALYYVR